MTRQVWVTRRLAVLLTLVLGVGITALSWVGERNSCLRQSGVRESARLVAETAAQARRADAMKPDNTPAERANYLRIARVYDHAAASAAGLSCTKPIPDTR